MAIEKKAKDAAPAPGDKQKALETAISQIEKQFGKGAVMRLGQNATMNVEAIPTGSLSLDMALGIGGLPRGRIVEIYGPESSGKTTVALHVVAEAQKRGGSAVFIDVEHALDPVYAKNLGVDIDELLVSQPDTGEQALEMIYAELYDLIVLDLNLPGVDGMEILRELRKENEETKVLILSARSQIADKVEGLDSGANDYMEKPFHLQELEARVRSLTRRKFIQKNICLECGKLRFDTRERVAYADDNPVALTRKENGILEYLLLNQGRPVSQEELIEHVWDSSVDSFSGSIRVHMSSLRKKLKAGLGYDPIVNKIGEGYKIGGNSKA